MNIDWDNYRALLIQAGASAEDAQRAVDEARAERAAVENGKCPRCHQPIAPVQDLRQSGPTAARGVWHQVRCPNCRYMADFLMADKGPRVSSPLGNVDKFIDDVVQVLRRRGREMSLSDIATALKQPENLVRCALDMAETKRKVRCLVSYQPHPVRYWKALFNSTN